MDFAEEYYVYIKNKKAVYSKEVGKKCWRLILRKIGCFTKSCIITYVACFLFVLVCLQLKLRYTKKLVNL